ncbi:MAG: glycogen synthase [Saprospiraceae bacterium]|nr:glycogen synthase [Saprospiraceae bacterium]
MNENSDKLNNYRNNLRGFLYISEVRLIYVLIDINYLIRMPESFKVHYLSAECYPAAKTGGLADVVGALPKYLNKLGAEVAVFMPKYHMRWFFDKNFVVEYQGAFQLGSEYVQFQVERLDKEELGFYLYVIDIPGKFDRNGVYADSSTGIFFGDEIERNISFQRAYLTFVNTWSELPAVIHNHDHHTGLVPFMMKFCPQFARLKAIPSVFTIHNQAYQGAFDWDRKYLLPGYDIWNEGSLDWAGKINPLAASVKCAWKVTTVSPSYMEELKRNSFGLEWLFNTESAKSIGILNGIDDEVWDPKTDSYLDFKLEEDVADFKQENKKILLKNSRLDINAPLLAFIGRFAMEKGADLLYGLIEGAIKGGNPMNYLILGTGDKGVEGGLKQLADKYPHKVISFITYNEKLSHEIYAGADFLVMPSRVEPCGLNQMYAMRYGTIPIVHNIGGLKDSVKDYDGKEGTGIKFPNLDMGVMLGKLWDAQLIYHDKVAFWKMVQNAMAQDNSWNNSAGKYMEVYKDVLKLA